MRSQRTLRKRFETFLLERLLYPFPRVHAGHEGPDVRIVVEANLKFLRPAENRVEVRIGDREGTDEILALPEFALDIREAAFDLRDLRVSMLGRDRRTIERRKSTFSLSLAVSFCSIVWLTKHLTVFYVGTAAFTPCSYMVSVHIS